MIRPAARGAIGCAMACGALLVGPSLVGTAVAKADLLGVGGGGGGIDVLGVDVLGGRAKGSGASGSAARLSAVSTAPSTRSVVIRAKEPAAQPDPTAVPAAFTAPAAEAPAVALSAPVVDAIPAAPPPAAPPMAATGPLSIQPPAAPAVLSPEPLAAPVIPSTSAPGPGRPLGPADIHPRVTKVPDSFRVGYPEYLRSATNTDLLVAAVPGVAGIAGFTLIGAFAGYRQAKAVQMALLAPVPTSFLL
jgi:hypothetical protein